MTLDLSDLQPRRHDGSHLTPDQASHIEAYMAQLLHNLDLGHWKVFIARDLPPEDAKLMIEPTDGRRIAGLYVSEDWYATTDAAQKPIDLTHEALHLAHHDLEENLRRFLRESGDISEYVKSIVISQMKTDLERMVDSLSYVVGSFMPDWVDPAAA